MPNPSKPKSGMFKAGIIVTIVGVAILIAGVWYGGSLANHGFGTIGGQAEGYAKFDEGSGQVELEQGKFLQLYSTPTTSPSVECEVIDPSGQNIVEGPKQRSTFTTGGESWSSFASFRTGSEGIYDVQCTSGPVTVAPSVPVAGIFMGIGGVLIALLTGGLGFLILLIGVTLWIIGGIVRRKRRHDLQRQSGNGYPA
ncbi:MAG: hypothetical protein ACTHYD_05860 [Canibacter sp.]